MPKYRFKICKEDGTTPADQCPVLEVEVEDQGHGRLNHANAVAKLHREYPGYDVVSWELI